MGEVNDPNGRLWWAVPTNGVAQSFSTPWEAQSALSGVEGDLYTQHGDGPRIKLGHRRPNGEWVDI